MRRESPGSVTERPSLGHYTLIREAGRGGMSVVYEASDDRIGRRVAVKSVTLPPHLTPTQRDELVARLRREARSIARLSHPNVVSVYDVGEQDGAHFLVMEYLDGQTLRGRLDTGPIPPDEAARILRQVADALDAVHAQHVVHRDIKPSNVMLLPDGRVKLMDFGVARQTDDTLLTQTGMMVGSPAYMAPEVIAGEAATQASDLWSLGVLLYQMLAGRPPFDSKNIPTVLYRVSHAPPEPLPNASAPVRQVLARALEKDPARRYPSGRALADDFAAALPQTPRPAPVATPRPARPPRILAPLLAVLLTALVLGGAAFLGHWLAARRQAPAPPRIVSRQSPSAPVRHARTAPAPLPRIRVAAMRQERARVFVADRRPRHSLRPSASAPRVPPRSVPRPRPALSPRHAARHTAAAPRPPDTALHRPVYVSRPPGRAARWPDAAPHPSRRTAAPQIVRDAPRTDKRKPPGRLLPVSPPRPAAQDAAALPTPAASAGTPRALTGTWHGWQGIHSHDPAVLQIRQTRGGQFDGIMTVHTPERATVRVALTGKVAPDGGVSMRETRILSSTKPHAWDLGFKSGRLQRSGQMSGTDHDSRGRSAHWSFSR